MATPAVSGQEPQPLVINLSLGWHPALAVQFSNTFSQKGLDGRCGQIIAVELDAGIKTTPKSPRRCVYFDKKEKPVSVTERILTSLGYDDHEIVILSKSFHSLWNGQDVPPSAMVGISKIEILQSKSHQQGQSQDEYSAQAWGDATGHFDLFDCRNPGNDDNAEAMKVDLGQSVPSQGTTLFQQGRILLDSDYETSGDKCSAALRVFEEKLTTLTQAKQADTYFIQPLSAKSGNEVAMETLELAHEGITYEIVAVSDGKVAGHGFFRPEVDDEVIVGAKQVSSLVGFGSFSVSKIKVGDELPSGIVCVTFPCFSLSSRDGGRAFLGWTSGLQSSVNAAQVAFDVHDRFHAFLPSLKKPKEIVVVGFLPTIPNENKTLEGHLGIIMRESDILALSAIEGSTSKLVCDPYRYGIIFDGDEDRGFFTSLFTAPLKPAEFFNNYRPQFVLSPKGVILSFQQEGDVCGGVVGFYEKGNKAAGVKSSEAPAIIIWDYEHLFADLTVLRINHPEEVVELAQDGIEIKLVDKSAEKICFYDYDGDNAPIVSSIKGGSPKCDANVSAFLDHLMARIIKSPAPSQCAYPLCGGYFVYRGNNEILSTYVQNPFAGSGIGVVAGSGAIGSE